MLRFGNCEKDRIKRSVGAVLASALTVFAAIGAVAYTAYGIFTKSVFHEGADIKIGLGKSEIISLIDAFSKNATIKHVAIGLAAGIVLGLVIGAIVCLFSSIRDKHLSERASDVRATLDPVRPIINDGAAVALKRVSALGTDTSKSRGTLCLTVTTLEFYNVKYVKPDKNFLMRLSHIIHIKTRGSLIGPDKLTIITHRAEYTFRVPKGSARKWKKAILSAAISRRTR